MEEGPQKDIEAPVIPAKERIDEIPWFEAVARIEPHVVRISTPLGTGTGFLVSLGKKHSLCSIATAAHVINHAHLWEEPIRIEHLASGKAILLHKHERGIKLDEAGDTAAITFERGELPLPKDVLPLTPKGKYLRVGNRLGWLGYPGITPSTLCFFSGSVSAWLEDQHSYLIDGVAIHGVSGGPAFTTLGAEVHIVGVVSAYMANRATGEVLPGLAIVRGVREFHAVIEVLATLEDAIAQQSAPPVPAPAPPLEPPTDPTRLPDPR